LKPVELCGTLGFRQLQNHLQSPRDHWFQQGVQPPVRMSMFSDLHPNMFPWAESPPGGPLLRRKAPQPPGLDLGRKDGWDVTLNAALAVLKCCSTAVGVSSRLSRLHQGCLTPVCIRNWLLMNECTSFQLSAGSELMRR
jgi:hypothetical protein